MSPFFILGNLLKILQPKEYILSLNKTAATNNAPDAIINIGIANEASLMNLYPRTNAHTATKIIDANPLKRSSRTDATTLAFCGLSLQRPIVLIRSPPIELGKKRFPNNPIEKYNQDIKDQIKTKRHFGSFEGAQNFLDLRHVIKNFINPHQGINGKTPAEAAGIQLRLKRNKLLNLIKIARKNHITKR